ncbi:Sugar/inositol transporter [Macleaya cordata]|uniref:Sugar/inositol transporter n=1 Tax=Macleaya cordata TaxID=56857 RepID=A0A200QRZ1_MACCD|nr:Sugar/inositol transporter [Macleaya cordata]
MGLVGLQENGNGENGLSKNSNKYQRMDMELTEDDDASLHLRRQHRARDTKKYIVFADEKSNWRKRPNNCVLDLISDWSQSYKSTLKYVGVMSGAILFIQEDLKITEVQQEILVGILSIVSLLGSLGGGRTSDAIGRKWTMGLAAVIFQAGALIMTLAPSFEVLMIGRLLAGVGIGFGVMIAPVYIAEISPTIARGSLTSFPEIFINLGILLGYVSNYVFSGFSVHTSWRIMLGVGILPSVFIGFALFIIPESPRWLVMQNRVDEARAVLLKTNENESEVEERLTEILAAAGMGNAEKSEEKAVWRELLSPSPSLRRMLITGFGIQCFQQITGIDATVYYSPTIFKDAGIKDKTKILAATVSVGFTKTIFILVAIILIDRVGRKPLLYVSTIGMTVCLFGLAFSLSVMGDGQAGIGLAILLVCGNVAFFSVGIGPVCWVLTSEIFPLRLRAQAAALGAVGNRVCSGLIAMSFLSVSRAITVGGTFFIFSLISALSVAFVYKCVPETKGKSLEQIELLFQKGNEEWQRGEVELGDVEHLVQKE